MNKHFIDVHYTLAKCKYKFNVNVNYRRHDKLAIFCEKINFR